MAAEAGNLSAGSALTGLQSILALLERSPDRRAGPARTKPSKQLWHRTTCQVGQTPKYPVWGPGAYPACMN